MTKQPEHNLEHLIFEGGTQSVSTVSKDKGYVFRDFEISRIRSISDIIRNRPVVSTLIFSFFLTFWVASLSYGATFFTANEVAINLSPNLAIHAIIVGMLIYPVRMLWIPVVVFSLLFFLPFMIPFTGKPQWAFAPEVTTNITLFFFGSNLIAGGLAGLLARGLFSMSVARFAPRKADMTVILSLIGIFLIACLPAVFVADWMSLRLDPVQAIALGFNDNFITYGIERTIRGSVVDAAFLMAALQLPTARQIRVAVPAFLAYPAVALLHGYGFGGFPMLDIGLMSILITLALPMAVTPIVVIAGMSLYVGMTGEFLHAAPPMNSESGMLDIYSIVVLVLIVLVMALRGRERYERDQHLSSIRRLSTVRGFAGVGLFTLNVPRQALRLDPAGQQLVGLPGEVCTDDLLSRFRPDEQYLLRHAFESESHASITLLLRLAETLSSGDARVLRLHLWAEPTPRGEKVVYGLMVEVTEEYLQEQALTDALNELSLRQDRQKQLFSIVSHEIRTPASVLSMLIEDLETGQNSPQLPAQMREASTQLLSVLDDMRQAVNPEKNQPVAMVPYTPADVAERVRNTYQMLAKGQDVRISLKLGPGASAVMMGDSNRLKQILGNLVRNAIIHSQGSEIRISYRPQDDGSLLMPKGTCWSVTDNGIGIPLAEVDRLFQPFERGSADARNQADGSGLGLFIAKQAVDLLGGSIRYFPAPEGGAGYWICLPDVPASAKEQIADVPLPPVEMKDLSELRIVLAEDNALVAQVTSKQLSRVFGEIEWAENGREALEIILKNPPDVLITDLFMPEMPGDELVQRLREENINIPMIGLTAAVVGDDIQRFEEAGATAVLAKPLDVARLSVLLQETVDG
ncbi:Autoinducer 2 sensor kinase/phosphatase LuxQ [Thalassovita gelatinovora]|uniref:histidine kinase n=1 Tax=Thalassovita gelatinovora TaxID=53501 RepID=A0A0P1G6C0_THAGE|nr:ATP-binding protein [Thalassovita gelatinovora]QIZ82091.1 response regulator [Thalassovita gelatinovora]CUH67637.1 Autoinducer 2 sensor kinase/phosphatase LuxQ [Thalassovita gelatinovora]SEP70381.1 Signal transduction histidine kinase [Thalassovita gelatinovora]